MQQLGGMEACGAFFQRSRRSIFEAADAVLNASGWALHLRSVSKVE